MNEFRRRISDSILVQTQQDGGAAYDNVPVVKIDNVTDMIMIPMTHIDQLIEALTAAKQATAA